MKKAKKNINKKFDLIYKVIFIICFVTCLYSLLNIIRWEKDNRKSQEIVNNLQNTTEVNISTISDDSSIQLINPENESEDSLYWYYTSMDMIDVDFNDLNKKNSDTRGWIQVPGTNINYPFVQSKDNKYYLTHSFEKKYTDAGWVFLDYRNDINNLSKNNIIYGHARLDKTMFGSLRNTLKNSWFNNKDNRIIKVSSENENTLWQIFSIYHIKTESYYITVNFKNDEEFQKYIDKSLKRSVYNFNTNVTVDDTILTLSTCYGDHEKLVVQAKLIKKEIKNF